MAFVSKIEHEPLVKTERFSKLSRLTNTTVYVLRFLKKMASKCNATISSKVFKLTESIELYGPVTATETKVGLKYLICDSQKCFLDKLYKEIESKDLKHSSYNDLRPFVDEDGLIRSASRLSNAPLNYNTKFPYLLPHEAPIVPLIIKAWHEKLGHSGTQHVLANLRKTLWITHGQKMVRKIIQQCTVCRRHQGGHYPMQEMPPLPKVRLVNPQPFTYTGIDFFGPITIKYGTTQGKGWVCLFTCCTTRAVHLEPVHAMKTTAFLGCMRRFISRRGQPSLIISDNAPTFKLGDEVLKALFVRETPASNEIISYFSKEGIDWKFIVEFAPWQGGFYERLVGVTKNCLKRIIGQKYLQVDELYILSLQKQRPSSIRDHCSKSLKMPVPLF